MSDTTPQISARELRDQFALYPTGVAVITAAAPVGTRLGMTVSSFNSVSLDPPLVSFNIATSAKSIDQWRKVGAFAVNLLTEDQAELSTRFARALTDKWEGITPEIGTMIDAPLLPDALAWFECETHDMITAGDHLIVLGKVKAMRRSSAGATRPLLFFASRYRSLKDEWSPVPYEEAMWIHGW